MVKMPEQVKIQMVVYTAEAVAAIKDAYAQAHRDARAARQADAAALVASAFGSESATDPKRRAIRLIEEAVELAQAVGVSRTMIEVVTDEVFTKPPGDPAQEVGGVGLCLLTLADALGLSADGSEATEVARCVAKHAEDNSHFRERDKAKAYGAQVMDAPAATERADHA